MVDRASRRSLPPLPRRARTLLWLLGVAVAAVVIAGSPVRGWWEQRGEIDSADAELELINDDNAALQARLDRMREPAEVERMARTELGMVREGEESYTILPPATSGLILPDTWPFNRLAPALVDG